MIPNNTRELAEFDAGNEHLCTRWERDAMEQHVRRIEQEIMEEYDIIIFTVSSLVDARAVYFSRKHSIATVLIDEAGQLTQPSLFLISQLNPSRVIFTGDHFQLQPTIKSFASEIAGLKKSQMEWSAES
jgi:ATP-dependent RNA/DNA helicase IGHMBP2